MKTFMPIISLSSHGFLSRSFAKTMAAAALLVGVATYAASAKADNVYWSVGLGSPGVTIGMTNARPLPIYVQPQPYDGQRGPVFVHPGAVYSQQVPIYVQTRPVYQHGWAGQGRPHGKGKKHDHHHDNRGHGRGR
jgi:hypothetical protein